MIDKELKPCPFCGNTAKLHEGSIKESCFCDNEKCILFARIFNIKDWNTRAQHGDCHEGLQEGIAIIRREFGSELHYRSLYNEIKKENTELTDLIARLRDKNTVPDDMLAGCIYSPENYIDLITHYATIVWNDAKQGNE